MKCGECEAVRSVDNLKREIKVTNNNNRVASISFSILFGVCRGFVNQILNFFSPKCQIPNLGGVNLLVLERM